MNDDPRDRFKYVSKDSSEQEDIFTIWDDQKKIARENSALESDLREAKLKSKELRKQLIKNKFGDNSTKLEDLIEGHFKKAKNVSRNYFTKAYSFIGSNKKPSVVAGVLLSSMAVIGVIGVTRSDSSLPATLGDATTQTRFVDQELPREDPIISVLTPNGSDDNLYDIVRISPPESEASYVFLDRHSPDGQIFRVTQQELPDNFEIAKIATDYQATNIIQVDDTAVYHGFSEEGGIQTLIFSKEKKLIFIRSPQKFTDEVWASYIASLK